MIFACYSDQTQDCEHAGKVLCQLNYTSSSVSLGLCFLFWDKISPWTQGLIELADYFELTSNLQSWCLYLSSARIIGTIHIILYFIHSLKSFLPPLPSCFPTFEISIEIHIGVLFFLLDEYAVEVLVKFFSLVIVFFRARLLFLVVYIWWLSHLLHLTLFLISLSYLCSHSLLCFFKMLYLWPGMVVPIFIFLNKIFNLTY